MPIAIRLLRRVAAIDVPNLRSSHKIPTPRGGGAPIAIGLVISALLLHNLIAVAFAVGVGAFGAIGLADDLLGLPAARRLAMQSVIAYAIAAVLVHRLVLLPIEATVMAVVIAVWLIGFVNAFNFMDGVNGISAAHALLAGAAYALLGAWHLDRFLLTAGSAIAACALAFLPWNAFRARVFLGDVGSYALGLALALLAAFAVIHRIPLEAAGAPLALYLADTAWTLQRRIRAGEPWLEAHRMHTYQRLCDLGWSHQRVTAFTSGVTVLLCLLGAASLTGHPALRGAADVAALGVLAGYLRSPALLRGRDMLATAS